MEYAWLGAVREAARWGAQEDDERQWDSSPPFPFEYRWEHIQQVVRNGIWLCREYPEADAEVVLAACWLHDIRKVETKHAQRGAQFARELLAAIPFPAEKIEAVAGVIAVHEGLFRPAPGWNEEAGEPFRAAEPLRPLEAAILWDSDKLAKVGPISHFHFMGWSFAKASRSEEPMTTRETHERNRRYIETLVPRTIASMNTEAARTRAASHHEAYLAYHRALDEALAPL